VTPRRTEQVLALLTRRRNYRSLAVAAHVHAITAQDYLKELHAAGKIFICGWQSHAAGRPTPYYRTGSLPDVPPPAAKSRAQRTAESTAKRQAARLAALPVRRAQPQTASLNWRRPNA
jgi:hypothetical protein